jgi:hypothetical protein
VVQPLPEVSRLVLVVSHPISSRPRAGLGPREAGWCQGPRGRGEEADEEESEDAAERMHHRGEVLPVQESFVGRSEWGTAGLVGWGASDVVRDVYARSLPRTSTYAIGP